MPSFLVDSDNLADYFFPLNNIISDVPYPSRAYLGNMDHPLLAVFIKINKDRIWQNLLHSAYNNIIHFRYSFLLVKHFKRKIRNGFINVVSMGFQLML